MISTLNMSREEWLQLRKSGIGGSDAGAICGLNPYASPMSVYRLQQTSSKTFDAFQGTINETLASNFNYQAPPETMACKVNRAGKVEHLCDKMIRKAHEEGEGKLIVRKYGAISDDNNHPNS